MLTAGAGWAQDDILLALMLGIDGVTSTASPSGWTDLASGNQAGTLWWRLSWILRGASNPSLTWVIGNTSNTRAVEIHAVAFTGCHPTAPIQASAFGTSGSGSGHPPDPPSVDVGTNGLVAVIGAHYAGSAAGWTAPSGYTLRSDNTTANSGMIATSAADALLSGTQNPAAFAGQAAGALPWWDGATISLAAAAGVPVPVVDGDASIMQRPFQFQRGRM